MKKIIRSKYKKKGRGIKRGSLDLQTHVFTRDKTPLVWGTHISLEPDVVGQLIKLGCKTMIFSLRFNGKIYYTTPKRFVAKSFRQTMGFPDCREQMLIALFDCISMPKQERR